MVKKDYKIYLEQADYLKLIAKAKDLGYSGKGMLSHYIKKIAKEPIVFLDSNTRTALKVMQK